MVGSGWRLVVVNEAGDLPDILDQGLAHCLAAFRVQVFAGNGKVGRVPVLDDFGVIAGFVQGRLHRIRIGVSCGVRGEGHVQRSAGLRLIDQMGAALEVQPQFQAQRPGFRPFQPAHAGYADADFRQSQGSRRHGQRRNDKEGQKYGAASHRGSQTSMWGRSANGGRGGARCLLASRELFRREPAPPGRSFHRDDGAPSGSTFRSANVSAL